MQISIFRRPLIIPMLLILPAAHAAVLPGLLAAADLDACQIAAFDALGMKPGQPLAAEQLDRLKIKFSLCEKNPNDPAAAGKSRARAKVRDASIPALQTLSAAPEINAGPVFDGSTPRSKPDGAAVVGVADAAASPTRSGLMLSVAAKVADPISPPLPVEAPVKSSPKGWGPSQTELAPLIELLFPPAPSREVTHKGRVEIVGKPGNQVTMLYLSGSPYEMGYEQGSLLKDDIKKSYDNMLEASRQELGRWVPMFVVNFLLDRAYARMAPHIPADKLEEMKGLAAGSGIPLKTIQRIHAIPDLSQFSCSGLVANKSATKDGHVYQLRILDYSVKMRLQEHPVVMVYRPNDGYAYANIGWAGFIGVVSGMNEKGVAISEKYFGDAPGKTLDGEPMPFVLEDVLRYAKNTEGAEAIVKRDVATNSYLYMFGDPEGGALVMDVMRHKKLSFRANDGDHVDWVESADGKPERIAQVKDMVVGLHFKDKTGLIASLHGKLDAAEIRKLAPQLAMDVNIQTVIYDLTTGEIWVANRTDAQRASDREFIHIDLKDSWSKYLDASVAQRP